MTFIAKLAAAALVSLGAVASFVPAASAMVLPPTHYTPDVPHGTILIDCRVKDNDFWVQNFGNKELQSGLLIVWKSPTTDDSGEFLLPKTIPSGESLKIADLLSDDTYAGAPCSAALV
jgi:hypothetical protein